MKARTGIFGAFVLAALSGCGEAPNENEPPAETAAPGTPAYRIVDAAGTDASCGADEQILSAYCFSDPGRSLSASGPAMQVDAKGVITVSCMTGGRNLRLFCVKNHAAASR